MGCGFDIACDCFEGLLIFWDMIEDEKYSTINIYRFGIEI